MEDRFGKQTTGTITFNIIENLPPIAVNDSYDVSHGEFVVLDVLDNDSDPEGHILSITDVGTPDHGTIELRPDVDESIWNDWINNYQGFYSSFEEWYYSYYGGGYGYGLNFNICLCLHS